MHLVLCLLGDLLRRLVEEADAARQADRAGMGRGEQAVEVDRPDAVCDDLEGGAGRIVQSDLKKGLVLVLEDLFFQT